MKRTPCHSAVILLPDETKKAAVSNFISIFTQTTMEWVHVSNIISNIHP